MKKLILIGLTAMFFTGCYSCGEAFAMKYDNCMATRHDKDFCNRSAMLEAQDEGWCTSSAIVFGFGTNTNYNYNY